MSKTNKYNPNNIFYKMINKEINTDIIYEDSFAIFIKDINPVSPIHILAISKRSYINFDDFISSNDVDYIAGYFQSIKKAIKILKIKNNSYRLITNKGEYAGQTIMHFHTHIIGGKELNNLL